MMKNTQLHKADVCVIGGGLAGICAAVSSARHGAKTVLIHDRPVFGGNCSSEIRMWPMGAKGENRRETGIFEEIVLKNMHRNPTRNYPIWDSVLYETVKFQDGLECILNCSVNDAECDGQKIISVTGWQLTSYISHKIEADIFIDCSGDSILAELTNAKYNKGRESSEQYGESAAPEKADSKTMGNSCLIQARQTANPIPFKAPYWSRNITKDELIGRDPALDNYRSCNFWWLELGGEQDTIKDSEKIRDDLVSLMFGSWDYIKNKSERDNSCWELDWAGFLPGKRESRRYVGAHILNQNEVEAGGKFDDMVAYGGWTIDNHPPAGFDNKGEPTKHYPCPSPFGIPYRCLYSANIENLMFAGRNISATHAAMAASRVMGTCAMLGQAAGCAAAIAIHEKTSPAGVQEHISKLQQTLMDDDCWLPGLCRSVSEACKNATLTAQCEDAQNLRNGHDRPYDGGIDNGCFVPTGSDITYTLENKEYVDCVRIIFDSDLNRSTVTGGIPRIKDCPTICNRPYDMQGYTFPATMVREFELYADGELIYSQTDNCQRLVRVPVQKDVKSITLRPISTYGSDKSHIFSFDF